MSSSWTSGACARCPLSASCVSPRPVPQSTRAGAPCTNSGSSAPTRPRVPAAGQCHARSTRPIQPLRQSPLPCGHAPPHHAQPRQHWNIVLGNGFVADQSEPVQRLVISSLGKRQPSVMACIDPASTTQAHRPAAPQPSPPRGRGSAHQQHDGHAMQHTKVDPAIGKHQRRSQADGHRTAGDLQPTPPEARPTLASMDRIGLAKASTQQEQAQECRCAVPSRAERDRSPGE